MQALEDWPLDSIADADIKVQNASAEFLAGGTGRGCESHALTPLLHVTAEKVLILGVPYAPRSVDDFVAVKALNFNSDQQFSMSCRNRFNSNQLETAKFYSTGGGIVSAMWICHWSGR